MLGLIHPDKHLSGPTHELQYMATNDGFTCLAMRRSLNAAAVRCIGSEDCE
jgi:hypothetical protein